MIQCPEGHTGPRQVVMGARCDTCGFESRAWAVNGHAIDYPVNVSSGCVTKEARHVCGGRWLYALAAVPS